MKKHKIIFSITVIALCLMVFSFTYQNKSAYKIEASKSKSIAANKNSLELDKPKSFPDFFYSVNVADTEARNSENNYYGPYLTIAPEKQAVYVNGMDALIDYLKESNKKNTIIVQKNKLKSGRLYFTVNRNGVISNVELAYTSGYPSIDKELVELIVNTSDKWHPAENHNGKKVEQKLILSFGLIGC